MNLQKAKKGTQTFDTGIQNTDGLSFEKRTGRGPNVLQVKSAEEIVAGEMPKNPVKGFDEQK